MMSCDLRTLSNDQLKAELARLTEQYDALRALRLDLDMSRGKPAPDQLDLSDDLLTVLGNGAACKTESGFDVRNYGLPFGVPEAVSLFASLLGVRENELLLGGNSSLTLMYDTVCRAMLYGMDGDSLPWKDAGKIKFLAPVPGYDRHFAICEVLGIELIPVPLTGHGPDMDLVESLVESDASIKGMWCVPKYSNPTGETYDDKTVRRLAALRPKASDFRIFWDMAYVMHDFDDTPDTLTNIFDLTRGTERENLVLGFFSTSKITYAGAGVAMMIASPENLRLAKEKIAFQTISPDKLNQLRHAQHLKNRENTSALMHRHAALLRPKFEMVVRIFREKLGSCGCISWTEPHGGYFLTLEVLSGTAKRTVTLCQEVGVKLTPAGATHPYHSDPEDKYIRIAPSYPTLSEVERAMEVVCLAAKLSAVEKLAKS